MTATTSSCPSLLSLSQLQARFLRILPRVRLHAEICFRFVRDRQRRTDFIAEVVAISWKWFLRLAQKGKDALQFPAVLADYAARAVRNGRRLCGMLKSKDVLNQRAQQRHSFTVSKLPDFSTLSENPLVEALTDNTQTPVEDQVQFRIDYPAWLRRRTRRDRRLIREMVVGERTRDLARRFHLSPSRIWQLRREYQEDWARFTGEAPKPVCALTAAG